VVEEKKNEIFTIQIRSFERQIAGKLVSINLSNRERPRSFLYCCWVWVKITMCSSEG
jgi:hypothetical protein